MIMGYSPEVVWTVIGITLLIAEIFVAGFVIFWFGVSAIVVAALYFVGISFSTAGALLVWGALGGVLAWIWFSVFKPKQGAVSKLGHASEAAIGRVGIVEGRGRRQRDVLVRFDEALMGERVWPVTASDLAIGSTVRVVEVMGNRLVVEPIEVTVDRS